MFCSESGNRLWDPGRSPPAPRAARAPLNTLKTLYEGGISDFVFLMESLVVLQTQEL